MNSIRFFLSAVSVAAAALIFAGSARAAEQVSIDASGVHMGDNASDRVGLYGFTTAQRTNAAEAALTDSTGGDTSAATLAAGVGVQTISIPVDLPSLANGNVAPTAYTLGYKFKVLSWTFVVTKPVTTGSKASTLTLNIGVTPVTGASIGLTSANCTPVGALVASTAITAANTGTSSDTLTVVAASTTAFAEGQGVLLVKVQNMDSADAAARQAKLANEIRTTLVNLGAFKGS